MYAGGGDDGVVGVVGGEAGDDAAERQDSVRIAETPVGAFLPVVYGGRCIKER